MCVFLHPGVLDEYKEHGPWSFTLDTLWDTQGVNEEQKRQLFDNYLNAAILASGSDSIGDLQFDIRLIRNVSWIDIFVPPEFTWLGPTREESVWTDITNDYNYIWTSTRHPYDTIAPGWRRVRIGMESWYGNLMNITAGLYHIRLFDLRAPEVAGLYHFKIYYGLYDYSYFSIGAGNFPLIIVKTELNPAIVEVTVRTHAFPAPPLVSGRVMASGTTPEGRAVEGIAWWGPNEFIGNSFVPGEAGALYTTYLFGLAAGTYTITAEASGFNPGSAPGGDRVILDPGQSLHIFIVIYNSPFVCVTVWSKHGTGAIPWHNLWQLPFGTNDPGAAPSDTRRNAYTNRPAWRDIGFELFDADGNMIGWWFTDHFAIKTLAWTNELHGLHDDGNGLRPTANKYAACLVDNVDLLLNARGYPSTHWDGHVLWDVADYVAGMPNGQYSVESYVTGYIMDEADAYQRQFSLVGSNYNLQFDLRRSNWIEVTMHMPAGVLLSAWDWTAITLTAEDAGGAERGAAAFVANRPMSADGFIDGADASAWAHPSGLPRYFGGIVIEGWNAVYPNMANRGRMAQSPDLKDYGLNPTPSSHSAGAVTLNGNPYTIRLYMADMGAPWATRWQGNQPWVSNRWAGTGWYNIVGGDPQASVFLCNSPVPLSFDIVNAWLWISLRSVDFEVPAHSRPWTFPGSEIWVDFVDAATGEAVGWLDPTIYGLIQDPGVPQRYPWGFEIPGNNPPGGDDSEGLTPFDIDNVNPAGRHEHLGVYFVGVDYTFSGFWAPDPAGPLPWVSTPWAWTIPVHWTLLPAFRSTRLPAGEYMFNAYTHGYVMRRAFPVQVPFAGWADIEADLIQGGQIRVTMEFRHEGRATAFNGFIRVEVFNAANELVGASIYGQAEPNAWTRIGPLGGSYFNFAPWADWLWGNWGIFNTPFENTYVTGPAEGAGLGFLNGFGWLPSFSRPQRAWTANWLYGLPTETWRGWSGLGTRFFNPWYFVVNPFTGGPWGTVQNYSPPDSNRVVMPAGAIQSFDVFGFHWYYGDGARTWAGGWPTTNGWNSATFPNPNTGSQYDYGLRGSIDIPGWEGSGGGLYSVKVWAFDARGPNGVYDAGIPVDDWRMYAMGWDLANVEVPWGGSVELFITMNNLASLRGTVRWFDMYGNLRPLPWAQVSASPGPATDQVPAYSSGLGAVGPGASDPSGSWIMWVPAGTHDVSVTTSEASQVWSSSAPTSNAEFTVVVSNGWVGGGDSQLGQSGTPVPELPSIALPIGLFAVLAASVWLLRRRTLSIPVLIK